MRAESWFESATGLSPSSTPKIADMNQAWSKISPITLTLVSDIEDEMEYWRSVDRVITSLTYAREPTSPRTDFSVFVKRLFSVKDKLKPDTPEDVVAFMLSSPKIEDSMFTIWKFSDCLETPYLFINSLNLLLTMRTQVKGRIAHFPGSLDFIFDHYFPMLETQPIENDEEAAVARINLFQVLCRLLTDYPDRIIRFKDFHRFMWNRLLALMRNSSITVSIAGFRTATQFYKATMHHIDGQTQAAWMLKLIQNNPPSSPLHQPSIRFAMAVRPSEFGFITLCKTMIEQGITDQCDLGMLARILRLPVIKNPTDIFQYLFKLACKDKLLANAARRVIQRPLLKFKDFQPMRPWIILFTKRCFEFVAFAYDRKKYIRRIYCILHFYAMLLTLNIDWLTKVITQSATTIVKMGKCAELFGTRFQIIGEIDPKMKEEIEKTPLDRLDLKTMLDDVKVNLQLAEIAEPGSGRPSARKPTIAEVKARFKAQKNLCDQTTDLAMLDKMAPPPRKP